MLFLGLVTYVRVLPSSVEDIIHARAINRIRHYYTEIDVARAHYFLLSGRDDLRGAVPVPTAAPGAGAPAGRRRPCSGPPGRTAVSLGLGLQPPLAKGGTMDPTRKLQRSRTDRKLAGICGGLAQYFNVDPTLVRVLFVLLAVLGGSGLVLYLAMWIIVPNEP